MGPVPRVCIPLRAVPPRRDASHARIPNAYRQLWMSLRRRLFHAQVRNFLPFASCLTLLSLCALLTAPASVFWEIRIRRGEEFVLSLENYFFPAFLVWIRLNSAKFRNWGKLFLPRRYLRSLFGNFTKLKNCLFLVWKNYFFPIETIVALEKNFKISYSNIYLSFENFGERERSSVWRTTCQKIRNWDNYYLNEEAFQEKDSDDESW